MINYSKKNSHDGEPDKISIWHKGVLNNLDYKDKKVLDIGCGTGGFLLHINSKAEEVTGIDPNPENCRIAESLNLKVLCDYPENIVLDSKFDIVTCFEVIEHLYTPKEIINFMSNNLVPGGKAFVTTPNAFNLMRQLRFILAQEHHDSLMDPTRSDEPEHIRGYSLGMMQRLVRNFSDLKVEKVYGVSSFFNKVFIFRNQILVRFLAQHLIAEIIKK